MDLFTKTFHKVSTKPLNMAYTMFSNFYKKSHEHIFDFFMPRMLHTQREIEERACFKLSQVLIVIKVSYMRNMGEFGFLDTPGEYKRYRRRIASKTLELLHEKKITRSGNSIFLSDEHIELFSEILEIDKEYFHDKAKNLKILRTILQIPSHLSYLKNELIEYNKKQYTKQYYQVVTKDGIVNELSMIIDNAQVTAGDNNPSVLLVPGIACNSNAFNINERYSIARDLAKQGYWVYLFEPRGMGINKMNFDIDCNLDTLIDYDLPAAIDFIYRQSKGKKVIIIGHSMGGSVAEFTIQMWAKKKDQASLDKVHALITLGAPKIFKKGNHVLFPLFLWLNYVLSFLKSDRVPLDSLLSPMIKTPGLRSIFRKTLKTDVVNLNFLINPNNSLHSNFLFDFIQTSTETFPLGIGFQFQKAIYKGQGITRMDDNQSQNGSKYNYTNNVGLFPSNIPCFHFLGEEDILACPKLNNFISHYKHQYKKNYELKHTRDIKISSELSQVNYYNVPKTRHMDLLYGRSAKKYVYQLLHKIIESIW